MDYPALVRAYLQAYASKDLAAVADLFAEDIQLRDWNISVSGKAAALDETRKNFAGADSLAIDILALHGKGPSLAAELKILLNGQLDLRVVDVIDFDAAGRICAIRAYLGRP